LLQRRRNSRWTKVHAQLDGLRDLPGNDQYGFCVTEFPGDFNSQNPCAGLGDTYNPEGINTSLPGYPARCRADHKQCAIGDLATRHCPLAGNDSGVFVEYRDFNLNLYGPNVPVGRGMVLKRLDTNEVLSCCNIQVPINAKTLEARFDGGVFSGTVKIIHPTYDYIDYTKNENTIIMVNLERIDGGVANIPALGWQIWPGIVNETCSHLRPPLGQRPVLDHGDPGASCSQTEHRTCRLGGLTTKCGPLQLVNNHIRTQCTDNQLGLVSTSTLDRHAISITIGNMILDCAQLNQELPAGAFVNFKYYGGLANIVYYQLSPQAPTYYRTYVIGLKGMASNILIYDGDDPDLETCTNLGNVLDYPGNVPPPNPKTCDQYRVGNVGPKMGGVMGKNYLRTRGLSSSIPLTGPVNILDKPIAVVFPNGSIWGCGKVENYYNAPYTPPTDIIDYLDLFKPCTP